MLFRSDNALRYSSVGGSVTVSVAIEEDCCRILVMDNGPGIPGDERARVLERFYRVPGSSGDGSGLGLAIVCEIVEAAGGRVRLDDPPTGKGLLVEVRLPLAG